MHPPLQSGWIDAPHGTLKLESLSLENGECIQDFQLSYAVHGNLEDQKLPVAIALCAIGSSHHRLDFLIGEGKALDPRRMRILAIDAIGNGLTSSPSTSIVRPRMTFPVFSIRDMVNSQKLLLDNLGISEIKLVIGASMGGMQALQWAVSFPELVHNVVALTPMAKTAAWAGAVNHAARLALQSHADDPGDWPDQIDRRWTSWSSIMQLLCSRTPAHVDSEFGSPAEVQQALKLRTRSWIEQGFDPLDWIYQSWAYDGHDVGNSPGFQGDTMAALKSIRARTMIATPPLDLYNPVEAGRWASEQIEGCEFVRIESCAGHSMATASDPVAAGELNRRIRDFVD